MTGYWIVLSYFVIGVLFAVIEGICVEFQTAPDAHAVNIIFWPLVLLYYACLLIYIGPLCWFGDGLEWVITQGRKLVGRKVR